MHSFSSHVSDSSTTKDGPLIDSALRRLDEVANEDVEMQPAPSQFLTYLVLDTNIVLGHLDVLQQFVADAEAVDLPILIIVPGIVISELDGQKNRKGLAWAARRASTWLLGRVKERRSVKGQAHEETCKLSGRWNVADAGEMGGPEANDDLIVDCCQYFVNKSRSMGYGRVVLCSADKNLCIKSESREISTLSPSHAWSSREIARALFGAHGLNLTLFDAYSSRASRQFAQEPSKNKKPAKAAARPADDDLMDIDDDEPPPPSHPLDQLHLEVIDHFSKLLLDLVDRVGGAEVPRTRDDQRALTKSAHAPSWLKAALPDWTPEDCIGYLGSKKRLPESYPRLEVFLRKPYSKEGGGRRGHDWPTKAWEVCTDELERVGQVWGDRAIAESMAVLRPYAEAVFASPMRPTGL
ncbi:hypothetical protein BV25DRAFT_1910536 [Artomyces pyxidatus]|uniref:Uncharacterized protein n=1 Tax=Artomyces pyxidatus TaxID=48021 RepID=A0ACB8TK08_9AGAM|nr:hypothetical protein BV25DRAFT_1910536 [Artomyces pyxidatus]